MWCLTELSLFFFIMKHYTYKITDPETNEFYYGSRSNENPESDSYMGSYVTWTPEDKSRLVKDIIKDDFQTREDAIESESKLIEEHIDDELNRNYYIPNKGFHSLGRTKSQGEKNKISKSLRSYHSNLTQCEYDNFVETMRNAVSGEKNPFYGKTHSDKTKRKMTESHPYPTKGKTYEDYYGEERARELRSKISKSKDKYKKPIIQIDLNDCVIREWDSCKEASRQLGISHIQAVAKGRRKTAGGYKWEYKYEDDL